MPKTHTDGEHAYTVCIHTEGVVREGTPTHNQPHDQVPLTLTISLSKLKSETASILLYIMNKTLRIKVHSMRSS